MTVPDANGCLSTDPQHRVIILSCSSVWSLAQHVLCSCAQSQSTSHYELFSRHTFPIHALHCCPCPSCSVALSVCFTFPSLIPAPARLLLPHRLLLCWCHVVLHADLPDRLTTFSGTQCQTSTAATQTPATSTFLVALCHTPAHQVIAGRSHLHGAVSFKFQSVDTRCSSGLCAKASNSPRFQARMHLSTNQNGRCR